MSTTGNPFKADETCISCGEKFDATMMYHGYYCTECREQ